MFRMHVWGIQRERTGPIGHGRRKGFNAEQREDGLSARANPPIPASLKEKT